MNNFRRFTPRYPDDSDFKTNAPSYYENLARMQKLFQTLTEQMIDLAKDTSLTIEEFGQRLDGIKEEMKDFFAEWLKDGTLEEVINERVFTEMTNKINQVQDEIGSARKNLLDETFNSLKERLDHDQEENKETINQYQQENQQALKELDNRVKHQGRNRIYLADFPKNEGESDDQWIQRALNSLDGSGYGVNHPSKEGTVYLEGREYFLENTIRLAKHQQLKGVGHATVLNMKQSSKTIIALPTADNENYVYGVVIQDMVLYGNGSNTGIDFNKSTHLTIRNVTIYDVNYGVWARSIWLSVLDRVVVRNYHEVGMGELAFGINGGTSVVFNNCWAKNFRKGYDTASIYTTFNSCACDTFIDFAYYNRQSTTLNGCGAEDGALKEGSFVFGSLNRGVVYNACETLGMYYSGVENGASFFNVVGGKVINNSFRVGGTIVSPNMNIYSLESDAYVQDFNTVLNSNGYTKHYFVPNKASASVVMEWHGGLFAFHRWNGSNILNGG